MKYLAIFVLLSAQTLAAQTYRVVHEKTLWRDTGGIIEIGEQGIAFRPDHGKESRTWKFEDIQYFDRISEKQFVILSYQDQAILLGRDRQYKFHITEGALTDEVFRRISMRLGKPATNRVVSRPAGVEYDIPVKHLHTFGGCEGVLDFTGDAIYYVTTDKKENREWLLSRDVQSIWSSDPYRLEIHAYDNNRREFSQTRVYQFELKKPLDAEFYRRLKLKLLGLDASVRR
jgi:hypothetical protein